MLIHVPGVLTPEEVAHCREVLNGTEWVDGRVTAGAQSAIAKKNLQVPEDAPEAQALGQIILRALGSNPTFNAAALPLRCLVKRSTGLTKWHSNFIIRFTMAMPQLPRLHPNVG